MRHLRFLLSGAVTVELVVWAAAVGALLILNQLGYSL